jgi:hypothetical protein
MAQFESLLWEGHPRRIARARDRRAGVPRAVTDERSEWTARPVGRLGRPLLGEIEAYLDFLALAREVGD